MKTLHFKVDIAAPVAKVWGTMIGTESYKQWTLPFMEGSHFEGSWGEGESIRFLSPSGEGMTSVIAANRPYELISIKHLGYVKDGVDDTTSEEVRSWAPAYENYIFAEVPGGTQVKIEQEVTPDFEQYMLDIWPKALAALKALCEAKRA